MRRPSSVPPASDVHERVQAFWVWVLGHKGDLLELAASDLVEAVYRQLIVIDPYLGVEAIHAAGTLQVAFTAFGDADRLPLLRQLVVEAPRTDWIAASLRQSMTEPFTHRRPGVTVRSDEIKFNGLYSASRPASIGIRVFMPAAVLSHAECEAIVWDLVTLAAGEERAACIEVLDVRETSGAADGKHQLAEMAAYIDWRIAKRR